MLLVPNTLTSSGNLLVIRFSYFLSIFGIFSIFTLLMNALCLYIATEQTICELEFPTPGCLNSSMPLVYAYIVLGVSLLVISIASVISFYLYSNSKLDYGELIEQRKVFHFLSQTKGRLFEKSENSLTKFKSSSEIKSALESSNVAQKRAGE